MINKPSVPNAPPKPPQERSQERYLPGDPIPVPEAIEADTESNWALFSDVPREPEPDFVDTVPASVLDENLSGAFRKPNT